MHRRGGTRTQIHTTGELSGAAAPGTPRYPFPPSTRQVHLDDDTEGSIANELLVSQLDFLHPAHLALHLCSPDRGPGSTEPHCYSKIKKPGF